MTGLVTFRLGAQEYAAPLRDVREVVRLDGLAGLPGMRPPLVGVLDLRGTALPVLDLRVGAAPADRGDVLVLERVRSDGAAGLLDGGSVGVAVDQVRAVVGPGVLHPAGGSVERGMLPAYVVEVLRAAPAPGGDAGLVFLVDLAKMVDQACGR